MGVCGSGEIALRIFKFGIYMEVMVALTQWSLYDGRRPLHTLEAGD
jgi:hypothetical protein